MKILISGGAGFIGSRLARQLVSRGHEVVAMDNLSPQIHGDSPRDSELFQYLPPEVTFIEGDVRNHADWIKALDGVEAVVHYAAETGTGQSMYEIERYVDVNVRGTAILLEILARKEASLKKLVVASSRSIYGEGRYKSSAGIVYPGAREDADMAAGDFECKCPLTGGPVELMATDEDSKIHPSSIYGITKQNQEQMVLAMAPACGYKGVALRYQNVYGPGQSLKNPYTGILSIFSNLFRQGKDINIFEDGLESRDFVFIDDVVNATVLSIENDEASGCYNVGAGVATNVIEVAEELKKAYQASGNIQISGNYRLGDIRHNYADLTKIRNELGFEPTVSFAEGIARFARWVETQALVENDGYTRSLDEMREKGLFK